MTRTTEARRVARTAQIARPTRVTPTPAEHDLLRDMAMVLKLTAKMSRDIRRDAAESRSAVAMN